VESFGFSMLRVASGTGHSIGQVHADGWLIPYYHDPRNEGRVLQKNMVITVEPFICAGSGEGARLPNDTRSAVTADNSLAVYWEHVDEGDVRETGIAGANAPAYMDFAAPRL
jgi:methionyl aminopeptidase